MAQSKNQIRPDAEGKMYIAGDEAEALEYNASPENGTHGSKAENEVNHNNKGAENTPGQETLLAHLNHKGDTEKPLSDTIKQKEAENTPAQEPFLAHLKHKGDNSHVRGRVANNNPNPVDVHVGRRMRLRRTMLSYSQQFVARQLGLTFQQVQKYEKGANRIGASRLWDISKVLQVSMDFFFEDMDEETQKQSPMELCAPDSGLPIKELAEDPLSKKETLQLVNAYYKIHNRKLAQTILEVITMMSKSNSTMQDK